MSQNAQNPRRYTIPLPKPCDSESTRLSANPGIAHLSRGQSSSLTGRRFWLSIREGAVGLESSQWILFNQATEDREIGGHTSGEIIRDFQVAVLGRHGQVQGRDGHALGLAQRASIVGRHGVLASDGLEGRRRRSGSSRGRLEHRRNGHSLTFGIARTVSSRGPATVEERTRTGQDRTGQPD